MHKSIKLGIIAGTLFAAGLFVTTTPVEATIIVTSNEAAYATVSISAGTFPSSVNSQYGWDQSDISVSGGKIWAALAWAGPQDLSRVNLEFTSGFMVNGFKAQYSTVASPSGSVDGNWQDITGGTFTGVGSGGQNFYRFNPGVANATGVRVLATDATNVSGIMRIREIWAFSNYQNLALTATVTAPGWSDGTMFNNEIVGEQTYGSIATAPTNTFTWATQQHIGGMLIVGGLSQYPADFSVQAWNGSSWSTVTNITGNTLEAKNLVFQSIVDTDKLRLFYTAAGGFTDGLQRMSEVYIFQAVPEPSTFLLLGLGGLMLWRKTRKA